jgi:site-specific DNA-cytosine methylase
VAYANGERPVHGKTGGFTTEAGMQAFGHIRTGCDARVLRGEKENHGQISERERFREPSIHRVRDGIPTELDKHRIEHLGNAIVPQVSQWIAERIKESLTREVTTEHG